MSISNAGTGSSSLFTDILKSLTFLGLRPSGNREEELVLLPCAFNLRFRRMNLNFVFRNWSFRKREMATLKPLKNGLKCWQR